MLYLLIVIPSDFVSAETLVRSPQELLVLYYEKNIYILDQIILNLFDSTLKTNILVTPTGRIAMYTSMFSALCIRVGPCTVYPYASLYSMCASYL